MVERAIGKGSDVSTPIKKATPQEVLEAVCKYYQIGKRLILSDTRARPIARPRQVLMYLLRTEYKVPLEEVGRITGGRDHTTVMHAVEKITQLATIDVSIREDISKIKMGIR
jgi:chromosomal replication initiator protein